LIAIKLVSKELIDRLLFEFDFEFYQILSSITASLALGSTRVGYSDSTPDSETNFETISTIHSQV
jgi:hypothetical protein